MARATGDGFAGAVRLVLIWGFGFALAVVALFALFGPSLIDIMTASVDVRRLAREFLPFVMFAPLLGVFAFAYDGIYIGATWARDMRNLMLLSLADLPWRVAGAAVVRQCRPVGRAAGALRRPRRAGGAALSRAVQDVVRSPYCTGQSSAVIVAASAPTISDSGSRPVRSSVEERSFLMSSTRPRPL